MRCFEKVSLEEFKKYYDVELYNFNLPSRSTGKSAGYDFYAVDDCTIKRGESKKIISGVKANMENNDVLYLFIRSSLAIKYNLILKNSVGVIDADYYNADNEGHIMCKFMNDSRDDKHLLIEKGQGMVQGIFMSFGVTVDDDANDERTGGIGSTTK